MSMGTQTMSLRRLSAMVLGALLLVAGCGDDDGGAAPQPDARPVADAAPIADAADGTDSPYDLVTCGADPGAGDAGPAGDAGLEGDAGPEGDAGVPPGQGDPCCDPDGPCPGELACIEGPTEERTCRARCDRQGGCPGGGVCASFGGDNVCIPASREGEECSPELCDENTICVGETADDATCRRRCTDQADCPENTTCTSLGGTDSKACL